MYARAPFNQTAERKIGFVNEDSYCTPGPAHYPEDKKVVDNSSPVSCSVFKSKTNRFADLRESVSNISFKREIK